MTGESEPNEKNLGQMSEQEWRSLTDEEQHTLWCLRTFQLLALGGEWLVPRSGLVFRKTSLNPARMDLEGVIRLPVPAEYVREDYFIIRYKFAQAGIRIKGRGVLERALREEW